MKQIIHWTGVSRGGAGVDGFMRGDLEYGVEQATARQYTLIAQSCIDHHVPLITRDGDFRPFARYAGLTLR